MRNLVFFIAFIATSSHFSIADYGGGAPVIVEQPTSELVSLGQPVTLNCRVEPSSGVQVTWLRNGQPVPVDEQGAVQRYFVHEGSLYFVQTERQDAGIYQCRAANQAGIAFSRNISLDIATMGNQFEKSPLDVAVAQSDSVRLSCRPPPAHPTASVSWRVNGQPVHVTDTSRAQMLPSGELVISDVRHHDQGQYTCVATNVAATRHSSPATLTVHVRPFFISQPANLTAEARTRVQLMCHVTGDPFPSVTWRRADLALPAARTRVSESHSLVIDDLRVEDEGEYVCHAQNLVGQVTGSVNLSVTAAPMITLRSLIVESDVGEPTLLPCLAQGRPQPSVYWLREGSAEPLSSWSNSLQLANGSLLLKRPLPGDQGYYMCGAVSASGSALLTLELLLRSQPAAHLGHQLSHARHLLQQLQPPLLTADTPTSSSQCTLSWSGRRLEDTDGVHVRYRTVHSDSSWITETLSSLREFSFTLTRLRPDSQYEAFVAPYFGASEGRGSNLVTFNTLEDVPSVAPGNVVVQLVNETNVLVQWSAPPENLLNGRLCGYRLLLWTNSSLLSRDYLLNDTSAERLLTQLAANTRYSLQLAARTAAGDGPRSAPVWFSTGGASHQQEWRFSWLPPLLAASALLAAVALLAVLVSRHNRHKMDAATAGSRSLTVAKSVVACQQQQQPLITQKTSTTGAIYRQTLVSSCSDAEYAELEPNGPYASTCVIRPNPLNCADTSNLHSMLVSNGGNKRNETSCCLNGGGGDTFCAATVSLRPSNEVRSGASNRRYFTSDNIENKDFNRTVPAHRGSPWLPDMISLPDDNSPPPPAPPQCGGQHRTSCASGSSTYEKNIPVAHQFAGLSSGFDHSNFRHYIDYQTNCQRTLSLGSGSMDSSYGMTNGDLGINNCSSFSVSKDTYLQKSSCMSMVLDAERFT